MHLGKSNENPLVVRSSSPTTVTTETISKAAFAAHWAAMPLPSISTPSLPNSPGVPQLQLPTFSQLAIPTWGCCLRIMHIPAHVALDTMEHFCSFTVFTKVGISVYLHCLVLIVGFILARRSNASLQSYWVQTRIKTRCPHSTHWWHSSP